MTEIGNKIVFRMIKRYPLSWRYYILQEYTDMAPMFHFYKFFLTGRYFLFFIGPRWPRSLWAGTDVCLSLKLIRNYGIIWGWQYVFVLWQCRLWKWKTAIEASIYPCMCQVNTNISSRRLKMTSDINHTTSWFEPFIWEE